MTYIPKTALRSYSTGSETKGGRFKKYTKLLKWTTYAILSLIAVTGLSILVEYSRLETHRWPDELRLPLCFGRLCLERGYMKEAAELLSKAWDIAQHMSTDTLAPGPPIKILSIAKWFADALEKNKQTSEAHNTLVKAVEIYDSRFAQDAGPDKGSNYNATRPEVLLEKLHLISVLCKLADLSDKCGAEAKEKWLWRAIIEMIPFSSTNAPIQERLPTVVIVLSKCVDPEYSQSTEDQVLSKLNIPKDDKSKEESQTRIESASLDATNVIGDDREYPLPRWHLPDFESAIATLSELIGVYAERRGYMNAALSLYMIAKLVTNSPRIVPDGQITLVDADRRVFLLRLDNRIADLQLRLAEVDTDPTRWLYRLHAIALFLDEAESSLSLAKNALDVLSEKPVVQEKLRTAEIISEYNLQYAILHRHSGTLRLKRGELKLAFENFDASRASLRRIEGNNARQRVEKVAAACIAPALIAEQMRLISCLEELKESQKGSKTTIKSHMTPQMLEKWEEIKRERSASTKQTDPEERAQT